MEEESELVGRKVKAHGTFDFMIRRRGKIVGIVFAKRNMMEEGMIQCAIGCEVAAELEESDIVHGIVTDYIQWCLIRSSNDKIEFQESSLWITSGIPDRQSLSKIAGTIYAMLSD